MVYYVKYWITVRQETPDVESIVVHGNSLSAPYLVKINTVRRGAEDLPSDLRNLDGIIPRTIYIFHLHVIVNLFLKPSG